MTDEEARDEREAAWQEYRDKMIALDAQNNLAGRGLIPSWRDWRAGWDAAVAAGEQAARGRVERFAEGAAAQFRSDLDYDGAEIKRRILMDAHLIAADHPGEGEPCPVCEHDDRLDDTDNEGNR